jgi:hypothetical protein
MKLLSMQLRLAKFLKANPWAEPLVCMFVVGVYLTGICLLFAELIPAGVIALAFMALADMLLFRPVFDAMHPDAGFYRKP